LKFFRSQAEASALAVLIASGVIDKAAPSLNLFAL